MKRRDAEVCGARFNHEEHEGHEVREEHEAVGTKALLPPDAGGGTIRLGRVQVDLKVSSPIEESAMLVQVEIAEYSPERGIETEWEDGSVIKFEPGIEAMILRANAAGLTSLARHMLTLAQSSVPAGSHLHYDEWNSLEEGSRELIIEKI